MAHDFKSVYRIDRALDAALTPAMIGMVYLEHARLAANLEAAYERHDLREQALISGQVQAILPAGPTSSHGSSSATDTRVPRGSVLGRSGVSPAGRFLPAPRLRSGDRTLDAHGGR